MLRLVKHLVVVVLFVVFAGCAGGGCSSGCSCGGVTPLAEGFAPEHRIENSASLRLTDSGLGFLEQNLGTIAGLALGETMNGVMTFEIPTTSGSASIIDYDVCPDGPKPNANPPECVAEIDLGNAQLDIAPTAPHNLHITGALPLRLQKLPVHVVAGFIPADVDLTLTGNDACPGGNQTFANIDLDVNVDISIDSNMAHSRYGYSRVSVNVGVDDDQLVDSLRVCGGIAGNIIDALLGVAGSFVVDPLLDTLNDELDEALCLQANPDLTPSCPNGTTDVGGICRYGTSGDDPCASIILGMDGRIDLAGLLASISPGTKGSFNFLFAAGGHGVRTDGTGLHWGDLNPVGAGVTLGMYGGFQRIEDSGCVTPVDVQLPTDIPIPDELVANTVDGWPASLDGPHFGFALSERFTNYALTQAYNSGALCLGITADALGASVPLTTALVGPGLSAPSMTELGRMKEAAPVAITLRPQEPPTIEIGNGTDIASDPLLRIRMNRLSFDFYAWSLDRYVRVMTATLDLDVPLNLEVTPDGLVPVLEELGVSNAEVTNSTLLREDPATIAAALEGLLAILVGGALGDAFPAIDLNEQLASLGLTLDIPPTVDGQGSPGLRKLTKDSDDFLGIFATLGIATTMNANATGGHGKSGARGPVSETRARLIGLEVDPEGLVLATLEDDNGPRATLYVGSDLDDGTRAVEWQYKLDKGPWHPFTRQRYLTIDDEWLRAQGRHTVYVRSRVVGDIYSLDPEPAEVVVRVDAMPPVVRVEQPADGSLVVRAWDAVSGDQHTEVRVRFDDGDWSAWMPANRIAPLWPEDASFIEVEAMDEEGLVGTVQQPILRGRTTADSGCDCRLAGAPAPRHRWPAWILFGLLAGLALARRRPLPRRARSALRHGLAAIGLMLVAGLSGCSCGDEVVSGECRVNGNCRVLRPGLIGSYTSAAAAPDGTVWVAGYLEANWAEDLTFGDLVVGRLVDGSVDWRVVDGLPADAVVDPALYDPKGFRGGIVDPGEDVGLWTSIAIDDAGSPGVAYFDATNRALRYAHLSSGGWQTNVVQRVENGDVGRYAELAYVGGRPVIAYLFIEPGEAGAVRSGVRLATGSSADAASVSWTFEEVDVDAATPCRPNLCPTGTACLESGACASKKNDCAAECGGDEECVEVAGVSQCEATLPSSLLATYPEALGLYVSMAKRPDGSLGLAYYDRIRGNLKVATKSGEAWTPIIVDGEDAMGADTGDRGIGASLAIDGSDVFHISYVDGLDESLRYIAVQGGVTPGAPQVADSGVVPGDGLHLVGDDSHILVTQGGDVRISYQDATAGQLRLAVGSPGQGGLTWQVTPIEQEGFAGFFSRQVQTSSGIQVLNWWRVAAPQAEGDVRAVSP